MVTVTRSIPLLLLSKLTLWLCVPASGGVCAVWSVSTACTALGSMPRKSRRRPILDLTLHGRVCEGVARFEWVQIPPGFGDAQRFPRVQPRVKSARGRDRLASTSNVPRPLCVTVLHSRSNFLRIQHRLQSLLGLRLDHHPPTDTDLCSFAGTNKLQRGGERRRSAAVVFAGVSCGYDRSRCRDNHDVIPRHQWDSGHGPSNAATGAAG